jgi:Ca-activated chloride channel family protein
MTALDVAAPSTRRPLLTLAATLALLSLVACEGSPDKSAGSTATTTTTTSTTTTVTAGQGGATARPAPGPMHDMVRTHESARAKPGMVGSYAPSPPPYYQPPQQADTSRFAGAERNATIVAADNPVSTFSIDVDTATYAYVRCFLREGRLPPQGAVRLEEMVNYFPYAYPRPENRSQPFAISTTLMPTPWNADTQLLHIAIKGYDVARTERPPANLVLLVDVSGSMGPSDRLPLLKDSFRMFVNELREDDRVAIVTYANGTAVALEPTRAAEKTKILAAIDRLGAGGGTAGAAGIQQAYALAQRNFDPKAVNRIVLATDGDFNVGISDPKRLEEFVAEKRKTGIYLTLLGVGLDNLNDNLMQKLEQAGNGNAAYIDSVLEARKVLKDELASTLFPIADDVKIQIEFNPARIAEYRLLGYETRMLKREDFNNDKVDAGEIGAGHAVTAIYEVTPAGGKRSIDPLRYGTATPASPSKSDEYAFLRIRYKLPGEQASKLIERPIVDADVRPTVASAPEDARFAAAVAGFAQILRNDPYMKDYGLADIEKLAQAARGSDTDGYRAEFIQLVRLADTVRLAQKP